MLARSGVEVELACRTRAQADLINATRENDRYLPGVTLSDRITAVRAADLELGRHDLVAFAVPAAELPQVVAAHASKLTPRTGVLVLSKGLVPPLGSLPSAFVAERTQSWAVGVLGGPAHAADALSEGASLVLAAKDPSFTRQVSDALHAAGLQVTTTTDVIGVELAGCAKNAAALAAAAAPGPNAAGAAAGKVFAEISAYARASGADPETFSGLAGTGDLVATVLAEGSRNRRAGELLAQGMPAGEIDAALGQTAEAVTSVPLLAARLKEAGVDAPVLRSLAGMIEGRVEPDRWQASLTAPKKAKKAQRAKAA
jgi:glycerol-3-phosphate dehydrogenase